MYNLLISLMQLFKSKKNLNNNIELEIPRNYNNIETSCSNNYIRPLLIVPCKNSEYEYYFEEIDLD